MNKSFLCAFAAALIVLIGTAIGVFAGDPAPPPEPAPASAPMRTPAPDDTYMITVGDILGISVWKNPDLDREVSVRPDGKISFPLVDEVEVKGHSISDVDKMITEKLKTFIRHPDVSVSFKRMAGRKIVILGEVRNPGVYLVEGKKTILEAIALAGGTTPNAVMDDVLVISGGVKAPRPHKVNLGAALGQGGIEEALVLGNRDVVYVPSVSTTDGRRVAAVVVWGEVESPGTYEVAKTKTIMEAIAMAGGTTARAALKSVVILKGGFDKPEISIVDLRKAMRKKEERDIVLAARDVVYVPRNPVASANEFVSRVFGIKAAPGPAPERESEEEPSGRER